jgi:hypothetical protein
MDDELHSKESMANLNMNNQDVNGNMNINTSSKRYFKSSATDALHSAILQRSRSTCNSFAHADNNATTTTLLPPATSNSNLFKPIKTPPISSSHSNTTKLPSATKCTDLILNKLISNQFEQDITDDQNNEEFDTPSNIVSSINLKPTLIDFNPLRSSSSSDDDDEKQSFARQAQFNQQHQRHQQQQQETSVDNKLNNKIEQIKFTKNLLNNLNIKLRAIPKDNRNLVQLPKQTKTTLTMNSPTTSSSNQTTKLPRFNDSKTNNGSHNSHYLLSQLNTTISASSTSSLKTMIMKKNDLQSIPILNKSTNGNNNNNSELMNIDERKRYTTSSSKRAKEEATSTSSSSEDDEDLAKLDNKRYQIAPRAGSANYLKQQHHQQQLKMFKTAISTMNLEKPTVVSSNEELLNSNITNNTLIETNFLINEDNLAECKEIMDTLPKMDTLPSLHIENMINFPTCDEQFNSNNNLSNQIQTSNSLVLTSPPSSINSSDHDSESLKFTTLSQSPLSCCSSSLAHNDTTSDIIDENSNHSEPTYVRQPGFKHHAHEVQEDACNRKQSLPKGSTIPVVFNYPDDSLRVKKLSGPEKSINELSSSKTQKSKKKFCAYASNFPNEEALNNTEKLKFKPINSTKLRAKGQSVPMRMRPLPQSYWIQPNQPNVSPGTMYLPPIFKNEINTNENLGEILQETYETLNSC